MSISHSKIEEEVRTRFLEAERHLGKRKKQKEDGEGDAVEEDAVDMAEWMSICSSDEENAASGSRVTRPKAKAAGKAKPKAGKKPKVSAEDKEAAKKANNEILGKARRGLRNLEAAQKEAKKALKSPHVTEDLQKESDALDNIVKECKAVVKNHSKMTADGKAMPALSLEADEMKELGKMVKQKAEGVLTLTKALSEMGDEALAKLAQAAQMRARAENID